MIKLRFVKILISLVPLFVTAQEPIELVGPTVSSEVKAIDAPAKVPASTKLSVAERIAQERIQMMRSLSTPDTSTDSTEIINPLSLEDALQRLIRYNKDVQKAKLQWRISQRKYMASFGQFEPYFISSYERSLAERYNSPLIEKRESAKSGLEGILPTATRYQFSFIQKDVQRAQSSLDIPSVSSSFSITQPLLKEFWGNGPFSDIRIAKAERQIAYNQYRSALMARCYDLENTYWKLVYLQEKYKNAEKSVAVGKQIVADSRTLVASGMMSRLDAVEAASQLAQRQTTLSSVRMEQMDAMNELLQMIGVPADSTVFVVTAVTPLRETLPVLGRDTLTTEQIDSILTEIQPDYLASEFEMKRSKIAVSQQRGKTLPELNVTGTWGVSGSNKYFGTAWDRYTDPALNNQSASLALELKVPITGGVRDRNLLAVEKLNLQLAQLESKTLKSELTARTVLASDRIKDLTTNLANAAVVVNYRTSLMESEAVRLKAGLSSVRKIFEQEQELATARESELEMLVNYRMAHAMHQRMLGTTLTKWGLETSENGEPMLNSELIQKEEK